MIAICRNYSSSLYRFQRTDGSVSTDMFIRTVNSEPNPSTKAKPGGSRASSNKNLKPRRSSRLDKSDALDNEDVMDGSPSNGFSTTTPCATVGSPAQSSPVMSMGEPAQGPEERTDDNKQEVASALTFMGPLSTLEEYTGIIAQLCHTYGVIALKLPNIVAHVNTMEQAVREDNRLALCQSFAKIKTILVVAAAGVDPDFLDEEYEAMVSSVIDEFGVELLNSTEGVMFMKDMGKAMVTGQREYRGLAYASLRAYMTAYTG
ncbi:hypothetical protein M436DRAFT_74973 [Aureobasidium namibiae CBS 147.97]|uniref:Uncharacterized protein n=1 Tax=Aureobasidium namibiae CBS 147.97 TaxID=1043004 RepID=A0A074WC24_9PEZI|nr:uncharacterized protein M436DRAFT_74973 [Aureobasidium namibiae CBS 147.97]KEQ70640.1 hypothetical protein M436DRAFT_74973 [Aureobasidium namibiae CBS 147.97]